MAALGSQAILQYHIKRTIYNIYTYSLDTSEFASRPISRLSAEQFIYQILTIKELMYNFILKYTFTGVYWSILLLDYIRVYWSIKEYTGVYKSILEYIRVYWSILEYIGVYWSILEYIGVYRSILEYIGVY